MHDFRAVLSAYSSRSPKLGMDDIRQPVDLAAQQSAVADLRAGLAAVSSKNRIYFIFCVAMIAILFLAACWISVTHLQDPSFIRNVFAVTGISFLGLIAQMVRLWKVKVMSDMLLVMAGNLNPSDLRPIIEVLLSSLKP